MPTEVDDTTNKRLGLAEEIFYKLYASFSFVTFIMSQAITETHDAPAELTLFRILGRSTFVALSTFLAQSACVLVRNIQLENELPESRHFYLLQEQKETGETK